MKPSPITRISHSYLLTNFTVDLLVWRFVIGCAPSYLTDLYNRSASDLASRLVLRSSARGELLVAWTRSALKQRRAFSVIGPSTYNELPPVIMNSLLC